MTNNGMVQLTLSDGDPASLRLTADVLEKESLGFYSLSKKADADESAEDY